MRGRRFFRRFPHEGTPFAVIRNHPPAQSPAQQHQGETRSTDLRVGLAVELAGLEESTHMRGFTNPSAFLGLFERPLLLASLVAGFPAFVGVWLVFKAASKWKGWDETDAGRRKFGVYSLNVAVSRAGVAVGGRRNTGCSRH